MELNKRSQKMAQKQYLKRKWQIIFHYCLKTQYHLMKFITCKIYVTTLPQIMEAK